MPISQTYQMDYMEYMKSIPDQFFELAIVDPPYGLDKKSTHGRGKLKNRCLNRGNIQRWDIRPSEEYFKELFRVSKNQIIWGGNYFPLPPTRCFVCWNKQQVWENFSQCELAWTSFNKPAKHVTIPNRGGRPTGTSSTPHKSLLTFMLICCGYSHVRETRLLTLTSAVEAAELQPIRWDSIFMQPRLMQNTLSFRKQDSEKPVWEKWRHKMG